MKTSKFNFTISKSEFETLNDNFMLFKPVTTPVPTVIEEGDYMRVCFKTAKQMNAVKAHALNCLYALKNNLQPSSII